MTPKLAAGDLVFLRVFAMPDYRTSAIAPVGYRPIEIVSVVGERVVAVCLWTRRPVMVRTDEIA